MLRVAVTKEDVDPSTCVGCDAEGLSLFIRFNFQNIAKELKTRRVLQGIQGPRNQAVGVGLHDREEAWRVLVAELVPAEFVTTSIQGAFPGQGTVTPVRRNEGLRCVDPAAEPVRKMRRFCAKVLGIEARGDIEGPEIRRARTDVGGS